jgi:hypothetical protein
MDAGVVDRGRGIPSELMPKVPELGCRTSLRGCSFASPTLLPGGLTLRRRFPSLALRYLPSLVPCLPGLFTVGRGALLFGGELAGEPNRFPAALAAALNDTIPDQHVDGTKQVMEPAISVLAGPFEVGDDPRLICPLVSAFLKVRLDLSLERNPFRLVVVASFIPGLSQLREEPHPSALLPVGRTVWPGTSGR